MSANQEIVLYLKNPEVRASLAANTVIATPCGDKAADKRSSAS
jgi:hypothetical protein